MNYKALFENDFESLSNVGVTHEDVESVCRIYHQEMLTLIAQLPQDERAEQKLVWTEGETLVDCLVPWDVLPEGYRLVVLGQTAVTLRRFLQAGFRLVRVQ